MKKTDSDSKVFSRSRRTFLQTSSAASVVTVANMLHPHTSYAESTDQKNLPPIRIGIIGCGGRGAGAVFNSLDVNPDVKIVAAADLSLGKCKSLAAIKTRNTKYANQIDITEEKMYEGLDGYKRILDDPDVDLVFLATPPGFRPQHLAEAVDAGKHIFAEKPSCVDPAGYRICLTAHEQAEKQGTAIVTGTQYRRQANYIGAVQQIRDGLIGDVISATSRYCAHSIWFRNRAKGASDTAYQLNNWMHHIWLSGDQIVEQAVHNIDAINWVMGGPPVSVYGSGGRFTRPKLSEMWDSMSLDYVYPGQRTVSFTCRQIPGSEPSNINVIYGTKGIMHIDPINGGSRAFDRDGKLLWSMEGRILDAYRQEHKDLISSIRNGKPIVELKTTADSSLTAVMGRLAAYSGKSVTWDFVTKESKLDLFPKQLSIGGELPEPAYAIPGKYKLT